MSKKIHRHVDSYEEIEVPEGYEICPRCKGKGKMSKYEEGWRSLVHSPRLAAKRVCWKCMGRGYVPIYQERSERDQL